MDLNKKTYSKTIDQTMVDEGLRAYMLKVYNYMTTCLILTGLIAWFFGKASIITNDYGQLVGLTSLGETLFYSPLKWLIMLAPLGFVFYLMCFLFFLVPHCRCTDKPSLKNFL